MHGAHSDLRCEINDLLNQLASRHERLFSQADSLRTENEALRARLLASRTRQLKRFASLDLNQSAVDGKPLRQPIAPTAGSMGDITSYSNTDLRLGAGIADDTGDSGDAGAGSGGSEEEASLATPASECDGDTDEALSRVISPMSPCSAEPVLRLDSNTRFIVANEDTCADHIPDERIPTRLRACTDRRRVTPPLVPKVSATPLRPELTTRTEKRRPSFRPNLNCDPDVPASPMSDSSGTASRWPKKPLKSRSTSSFMSMSHNVTCDEVPLWQTWAEGTPTNFASLPSARSTTSMLNRSSAAPIIRGGDTMRDVGFLQHLVLGPNAKWRFIWDVVSVLAVTYDVLTVPLIAFGSNDATFYQALRLATTIFWTTDIPVTFLSGFHVGGIVEMRPRKIAEHYIKRWFFIDLIIVVTDWMLFFLYAGFGDAVNFVRITKTMRLSRILRLFRLLRVAKVTPTDDFYSGVQSETLMTVFGVGRSLAVIFVVNHFIACGWYAVGMSAEPSWVEALDLESRDTGYRYLTSLHWSLTQFTPASMEISPRNSYERLFAIVVLFSALVSFSTFISSITNAMTTLRRLNAERSKQSDSIRRYIADNRVSLELGNRITTYLRTHNYMAKKRIHEADIQIFKVLPESLRLQLHWEVYMPLLTTHPFFHHLTISEEQGMVQICHTAMRETHLATCQELFSVGQNCTRMHFLISGMSEYSPAARNAKSIEVNEGAWFSEACLWVRWTHRGNLHAVIPCEIVSLDSARFRRTMAFQVYVLGACCAYARMYQLALIEEEEGVYMDIWCDFDRTQEMVQTAFEAVEVNEQFHQDQGDTASAQYAWKLWRSWSPRNFVHGAFGNLRSIMVNRSNTA